MSGFNRRDFFKGLGATALMLSSPEKLIMGSILDGVLNNARAQSNGVPGKNLINIFMPGGPSRWYFDLPIRPNGNDTIVDNKMVKTRFSLSSGSLVPEYDTFQVGNSFLPYLWKSRIPTADGSTVPMGYLAMSAVFIRGYDMVNDSHDINLNRHNAPVSGNVSLSGIFADNSNRPFPNVRTSRTLDHKSAQGKSSVRVPIENTSPFVDLMAPFNLTTQQSFNRREAMDQAIKNLHKNLSGALGAKNPYTDFLLQERDSAIDLYTKGVDGLATKYTTLYNKYRNLEVRSYTSALGEGLDDNAIPVLNNNNYIIDASAQNVPTSTTPTGDLRTLVDGTTAFGDLAKSFAAAEYIITEGLSSSFMMNPSAMNSLNFGADLKYALKDNLTTMVTGRKNFTFDAHFTGAVPALYVFSHAYRAFAACLYELITQLKAKNIYNDSIIQLSSEFNRSAAASGAGADHGFTGCGTSLYSGIFEGTIGSMTIGNIAVNSANGSYKGTWGLAAKSTELGNRNILIGNLASTVTHLMGYQSPTPNDVPLIKIDGAGKLVPILGAPKNV